MLKVIRRVLGVVFLLMITFLFLDFTGTIQRWFGWMAKIQLLPSVLALNFGVILFLFILTLILGRVYCSVICPLGVMQDCFGWIGKKVKKNRYSYSRAKNILRYTILVLMVLAMILGVGSFVALLAPYSAYGRISQTMLAPIWIWCNNILASWAEANDSYLFYHVESWHRGYVVLIIASLTLITIGFLAFRNGRSYCNTICPVGTILGFISRFSILKPVIDTDKCNSCGLCARNCKAACINSKEHTIDYSRCVTCFDCIGTCHKNAISYIIIPYDNQRTNKDSEPSTDASRRNFLSISALVASTALLKAEEKFVDGGLAAIEDKKIPNRKTKIVPPGAVGIANLTSHCTACQLCVSACPNKVLRPSTDIDSLMQPESSYESGYCRPECTKCSYVCPTGAIKPISRAEKSSIQIGHAVWIKANCIPLTDDVECGNCARHCPTGAITMVASDSENEDSRKIPVVKTERCIGCGACENLCPSRPFSAIYVEGHETHRII